MVGALEGAGRPVDAALGEWRQPVRARIVVHAPDTAVVPPAHVALAQEAHGRRPLRLELVGAGERHPGARELARTQRRARRARRRAQRRRGGRGRDHCRAEARRRAAGGSEAKGRQRGGESGQGGEHHSYKDCGEQEANGGGRHASPERRDGRVRCSSAFGVQREKVPRLSSSQQKLYAC